jgi:hypothetical protein
LKWKAAYTKNSDLRNRRLQHFKDLTDKDRASKSPEDLKSSKKLQNMKERALGTQDVVKSEDRLRKWRKNVVKG